MYLFNPVTKSLLFDNLGTLFWPPNLPKDFMYFLNDPVGTLTNFSGCKPFHLPSPCNIYFDSSFQNQQFLQIYH